MTLTEFAVTVAWIPAAAFPVYYWRARWYATAPGRSVMTLAIIIAVAMTFALVRTVLELDPPEWVRVLAYLVISGGLWFQFITLLAVQRRKRQKDREETDA